jgi:signal transduction histidine kinase
MNRRPTRAARSRSDRTAADARSEAVDGRGLRLAEDARDLLLIAGHDLRTPLATIRIYAETIAGAVRRGEQPSAASWGETMDRILTATAQAEELVADVLTHDRLMSRPMPAVVDLREVIDDVIAGERHSLEQSRSTVTVAYEGDGDVRGRWDRGHLTRMLTNLLRNSITHAAGAAIRIGVGRSPRRLRIDFADRGPGLDAGGPTRLNRASERRSLHRGGGLGLWIVRHAVSGMSGTMQVRSDRTGTRVRISLPAASATVR